jgi:hypothetical protein
MAEVQDGDLEERIYALNPAQICVNDIVLISGADGGSIIVRTGTRSDYSHAALCTQEGMLIEAVPQGVMRRSVIGTFATRPEWLKVLRSRRPLGPNAQGLHLAHYAVRLYGRGYSMLGAITSVIEWIHLSEDGSTFCSRVIAEAFHDYGIDLLPGRPPAKVYPAMLLKSEHLIDVTSQSVRSLHAKTDRHLFEQVITTAEQELPGHDMQMNRRVFRAIRQALGKELSSDVASLADLWAWLAINCAQARSADPAILKILDNEGFVEWYARWAKDVAGNAQLFEGFAAQAERATQESMTPELQEFIQQFLEYLVLDDASLQARKTTMEQFVRWAEATQLSTFNYLSNKYQLEYGSFARLNRANHRLLDALSKFGT